MSKIGRLLLIALLTGCASSDHHNEIARSKSSAVVVVHAAASNAASVDQETVSVNARNGKAANGTSIPSQVLWFADDPRATLAIEWVDPQQQCVRGKHCQGNQCSALTNPDLTQPTRCEYKVWINNREAKDPIIVVDNCCP